MGGRVPSRRPARLQIPVLVASGVISSGWPRRSGGRLERLRSDPQRLQQPGVRDGIDDVRQGPICPIGPGVQTSASKDCDDLSLGHVHRTATRLRPAEKGQFQDASHPTPRGAPPHTARMHHLDTLSPPSCHRRIRDLWERSTVSSQCDTRALALRHPGFVTSLGSIPGHDRVGVESDDLRTAHWTLDSEAMVLYGKRSVGTTADPGFTYLPGTRTPNPRANDPLPSTLDNPHSTGAVHMVLLRPRCCYNLMPSGPYGGVQSGQAIGR